MYRPTLLEIFRLMVRRTIGFSDYWSFGPMVHRNIGMSPCQIFHIFANKYRPNHFTERIVILSLELRFSRNYNRRF